MKKVHAECTENAENIDLTLSELSPANGGMKMTHYPLKVPGYAPGKMHIFTANKQMSFQKFIPVLACCSFILFLAAFISPQAGIKPAGRINNIQDTIPVTDTTDEKRVFEKVEIEASYPGGDKAWRKFLESNLDGSVATSNGAPVGVYMVIIQFVVNKEGYITEIKPLTSHGYGMENEVTRLLKKSPRWKPAIQDGRAVKAFRRQPVTFMVQDGKRKRN